MNAPVNPAPCIAVNGVDADVGGPMAADAPTALYADVRAAASPFRVVMITPLQVPAWLLEFAQAAVGYAWIDLLVMPVAGARPEPPIAPPRDVRAYLAVEQAHHRHAHGHDPLARTAIDAFDGPATAAVSGCAGPDARGLHDAIRVLRPDLIVLYGPRAWGAPLAGLAEWGCWNLDESLVDPDCGGLPLLVSILEGHSATPVALELELDVSTAATSLQVPPTAGACAPGASMQRPLRLASSWGTTHSTFRLQREQAFLKVPALLLRALRKFAADASSAAISPTLLRGGAADLRLVSTPALPRAVPGLRATAIALQATAKWQVKKRRRVESWALLLRHAEEPIDPSHPRLGTCSVLAAPGRDYWADPCVVEADGRCLIFVEEYVASRTMGVIACLEVLDDGSARRLGITIDEPFHLSYPQAFLWEGEWYMTLESSAARCVTLYRATDFPMRWTKVANLISGWVCVDGTLHWHDGHWYLFVNIAESGGSTCDELFMFVADHLTGPYRPHPGNPIVTDVRRARSAGRLFQHDGRLIRPSQDCAPEYGAAIVFNEILELSPTAYRERTLSRLDPDHARGMSGCHTYSSAGRVEVLDARGRLSAGMRRIVVADAPVPLRTPEGSDPLVSVIMIAQGGPTHLARAIDNVLDQTCSDLELILLVDGCDDAVNAACDHYAAGHPGRVRIIRVQAGSQALSPRDGLAIARGRYFAILGGNQVWLPGYVLACVTALERDAGLGLVHANSARITLDEGPFDGSDGTDGSDGGDGSGSRGLDGIDPYAGLSSLATHPDRSAAVIRSSVAHSSGAIDDLCHAHGEGAGNARDAEQALERGLSRLSKMSQAGFIDDVHVLVAPRARWYGQADDLGPTHLPPPPVTSAGRASTVPPVVGQSGPEHAEATDAASLRLAPAQPQYSAAQAFAGARPTADAAIAAGLSHSGDRARTAPPSGRAGSTPAPAIGMGIHYLRYSTANLLVLAAGFISFPVLTRLLDNAQYGILGYYEAWVAVAVAVAKLGTQHSLVRFYPFNGSAEKLEHFATNLVALPLAISLSLCALVAFVLGMFSLVSGSGFSPVFWCAFVSVPLLVLASVIEMIMRASERSLLLTVTRVAKRWLELLLVLGAVIALQQTALAVYWGRLAAAVLVVGYCIYWARRNLSFSMRTLDVPAMLDSWRYGLPLVANEIAFIVLISVDRVMLKQMTGDFEAVGIYTIGYSLAMQINILMQASLYEAFVPVANRIHDSEGAGGVRALKKRILLPMTYASIGIAALILGVGNEAMVALSGPSKAASGPVFVAIGITFALYPLIDIAGYGLLLRKKSMLVLAATFAAAVFNIALNLVLIPRYGVMGAVVATTGSYILLGAIKCALCPRSLRGFPELRTVLLACSCAAVFLAVIEFGHLLGDVSTWSRLLLAGLLFLVLYALPVWLLDPHLRGMVSTRREARFA